MRNPLGLKLRHYTAYMIKLNQYLAVLPGEKAIDKCFEMEFNDILLNRMPNIWIRKEYMQGFDCEPIAFKISINMFKLIEIE